MNKLILASMIAASFIGCNKDKKAEIGSSSAAVSSSGAMSSTTTGSDSSAITLYGPAKVGSTFSYCTEYNGSDKAAFKAQVTAFTALDGGELEWGNACSSDKIMGKCTAMPLEKNPAEKVDVIYYASGMDDMDKTFAESFKQRCEENKGKWVK